MRLLIVLLLSLTIASADQYGGAAPAPKPAPQVEEIPAPATCGLPARLDADCTAFAQRACSGGVTTTFQICRNVVSKLCTKPVAFADVATCVANSCGSLNGDKDHPTATVRAVCSGTFNTAQISAGEKKYFPTGIPAEIDGVTAACAKLVCQAPPPPPPVETTEVVLAEPPVPPAPAVAAAYQAQVEAEQEKPAPAPVPAPVPAVCALPAKLAADCTKFAQDACSGGVTATFAICRRVAVDLCQKPKSFADIETCVRTNCGSLEGDAGHPTETVRQVCGGTYDTKKVAPSFLKYFPTGVPAHIDGVRGACEKLVCAQPEPVPAPVTTEEIKKEPFVEPAPGLTEAYNKQQEKAAPPAPVVPAPQPTPVVVPVPAPTPVVVPAPTPVVVPAPQPVVTTPVTQDCSVIMVDADEEDCTAELKKEVEQLEKYVDQLTILLASKGAKFTEACVVTTGGGGDKPKDDKPNGGGGKGGDDKPKDDKPNGGGGKGGDDKPKDDKPNGGGGKGGDDKPKTEDKTGGGNGGNNTPNNNGGNTGNGNQPQQNAQAGVTSTRRSSSAGVSAALVAGLVAGSAVCAGIVAVAIGFFVAAPAAGGAAVVSAAPMACAATNPLYVPLTNGGTNLLA